MYLVAAVAHDLSGEASYKRIIPHGLHLVLQDNGKPLSMARHIDVPVSIHVLEYYAGWADGKITGARRWVRPLTTGSTRGSRHRESMLTEWVSAGLEGVPASRMHRTCMLTDRGTENLELRHCTGGVGESKRLGLHAGRADRRLRCHHPLV